MKINLFKNFESTLVPYTSISSNNSIILMSRKDKTVDLLDSHSLNWISSIDMGYSIACSTFLGPNTVVLGTDSGELIYLSTKTMERRIVDADYPVTHVSACQTDYDASQSKFIFATSRKEIYQRKGNETRLLFRSSQPISALLMMKDDRIVFGDAKGRVVMLKNRAIQKEMTISSAPIKNICCVGVNQYVAVCGSGYFYYLNLSFGVLYQKEEVRTSALNVCTFLKGILHLSGEDSRLICYTKMGEKFIRSYQTDNHAAEVLGMAVDNGRICTVGEDGVLSVCIPLSNRYHRLKVFPIAAQLAAAVNTNIFCIADKDGASFYSLEGNTGREKVQVFKDHALDVTFKLPEHIRDQIGYEQLPYRYLLKMTVSDPIKSMAHPPSMSYIAYTNAKRTEIVDLAAIEKIHNNKVTTNQAASIRDLEPTEGTLNILPGGYNLVVTEDKLIIQTYNLELLIFDRKTRKLLKKYEFEDIRERILCVKNYLILTQSKKTINLDDFGDVKTILVPNRIISAFEYCNNVAILSYVGDKDLKRNYKIDILDIETGNVSNHTSILSLKIITGIFSAHDSIVYTDGAAVVVIDKNLKENVFKFGAVVYATRPVHDGLLMVHDSWSHIVEGLPPSVHKPKFANQ